MRVSVCASVLTYVHILHVRPVRAVHTYMRTYVHAVGAMYAVRACACALDIGSLHLDTVVIALRELQHLHMRARLCACACMRVSVYMRVRVLVYVCA